MNDWIMRGMRPTRVSYLPDQISPPFRPLWESRLDGAIIAEPLAMDEKVFVATTRLVYCLSFENGNVLWKFSPGEEAGIKMRGMMQGTPAIWKDRVFFADHMGYVYALEKTSGKVIWKRDLGASNESILMMDDAIFTKFARRSDPEGPLETGYLCLSMDGETVWEYISHSRVFTLHAAGDQERMVFGDQLGFVYAVSTSDGHQLWEFDTNSLSQLSESSGDQNSTVSGSPFIILGQAILTVGKGAHLLAMDLYQGEPNWIYKPQLASIRNIACAQDYIIHTSSVEPRISKVNIRDGKEVVLSRNSDSGLGDTVGYGGTIVGANYYCGFNRSSSVASFSVQNGEVDWIFTSPVEAGFTHAPVFSNDRLIVGNDVGILYCLVSS